MFGISTWKASVLGALCAAAFVLGCSSSSGAGDSIGPGNGNDAGAGSDASASDDGGMPDTMFDATPPDAPAPSVMPPPAHGALFGAFAGIGMEVEGDTASEQLFTNEEGLIGRRWVIDNRFYDDKTEWVNDRTKWDIAQRIVPMITWMPYGNGDPLGEIVAGQHDAAITAEAQKAKALGAQILMRWGHEMNGNWYPWSGWANGGACTCR